VYEKALESLARGAAEIEELREHPLTPPEKIAEKMQKYDALAFAIRAFNARCMVEKNPTLREHYENIGLIGKDEVI